MSKEFRKRLITGAIVFTLATAAGIWVKVVSCPLKDTCTKNIAPLEVTISAEGARFIVEEWKTHPGALDAARRGVHWDFLFILTYMISFGYFCWWSGEAIGKYDPQWKRAGRDFTVAAVVAGILDVVENFGLLAELNDSSNRVVTAVKALASMVKWILIALMTLYIVVSFALWVRIKLVKDPSEIPELLPPPFPAS